MKGCARTLDGGSPRREDKIKQIRKKGKQKRKEE
jgi:hypothetical protein